MRVSGGFVVETRRTTRTKATRTRTTTLIPDPTDAGLSAGLSALATADSTDPSPLLALPQASAGVHNLGGWRGKMDLTIGIY